MSAVAANDALNPGVHPAAELFPLMDLAELQELAKDIKEQGLLDAIVTWQGQLLDGRNRLKACVMAGVKPTFVALKRLPGGDPVAFVLAKNLKRRHLTAPQRAVLAVHAAELMAADAKERQREGGRAGGKEAGKGRAKASPPKGDKPKPAPKTTARAAKAAGAGKNQVEAMAAVKRKAPDVFDAVKAGTVETVADAKRLASVEEPKERKAALRLVKEGMPAKIAVASVAAPAAASNGSPSAEDRMKTIARLMKEARPLSESLNHKLQGVIANSKKIGAEHIGGLGGFRFGVELTALRQTLNDLKGLFP